MFLYSVLVLYFFALVFLAWRNFRWAVFWLILVLPVYLIRFNIGPLPSTVLELTFGAVFLIWLIKYARADYKKIIGFFKEHKFLTAGIILFFIASLASCFVSDMVLKSLGQWRAYFLEPMLLFLVLLGRREEIKAKDLILFSGLSTLSVSLLAIIQKLTGSWYDPSLWADNLNGRVTSFFTTPNAIGLYLAPLAAICAALAVKKEEPRKNKYLYAAVLVLSLLAIFFSFSQGAWVALGVGAVLFVYLVGYKKIAGAILLLGIILALAIPLLRSAVLFQDKAGQNRLKLWHDSMEYLTASPKNFLMGTGVRQFFRKIEKSDYNPQEMERLIYPHNIFLNFWTETGLLGMLGFIIILSSAFYFSRQTWKKDKIFGAGLLAALVIFLVHGLVDVPYFKNDLAMLFWVLMAVCLTI